MRNRGLTIQNANRYIESLGSRSRNWYDSDFKESVKNLFNPELIKNTSSYKIFHFLQSLNLILRNKSIKPENRIELEKYTGHIPSVIEPPRNSMKVFFDFLENMRLNISDANKKVWLIKFSAMIIFCHIFPNGNGRLVRYIYHIFNNSHQSGDNITSRPSRFDNFFEHINKMAIIRVLEKYRMIDSSLGLKEKMDKSENFFGIYISKPENSTVSLFEFLVPKHKELVASDDINRNLKLLALICYYIQTDQEDKIINDCKFTPEILNSSIYLDWYDHIANDHIKAVLDEIDEESSENFSSFFSRFTKSFE